MTPEGLAAILIAVGASGITTGIMTLLAKRSERNYSDSLELRTVLKAQISDLTHRVETLTIDHLNCERQHRQAEDELRDVRLRLTAQSALIAEMTQQINQLSQQGTT